MRSATIADAVGGEVHITWEEPILDGDLDPSAFTSNPSGQLGGSFSPLGPQELSLLLSGDITGDTEIVFSDVVPGFLGPQTKNYS